MREQNVFHVRMDSAQLKEVRVLHVSPVILPPVRDLAHPVQRAMVTLQPTPALVFPVQRDGRHMKEVYAQNVQWGKIPTPVVNVKTACRAIHPPPVVCVKRVMQAIHPMREAPAPLALLEHHHIQEVCVINVLWGTAVHQDQQLAIPVLRDKHLFPEVNVLIFALMDKFILNHLFVV